MGTVHIVPADYSHVPALAATMRESDVLEVAAATGEAPGPALQRGLEVSDRDLCFTALTPGGVPVGMFGVSPLLPGQSLWGCAWLLTSHLLDVSKRCVWELSKHFTQILNARYPLITNWVDDRNTVSRAWLVRLGFFKGRSYPRYGVQRLPFTQYIRLNQCVTPPLSALQSQ